MKLFKGFFICIMLLVLFLATACIPLDQLGVLVFTVGLGSVLAALLFCARQWFFPHAPGLTVPLFLLAVLVNLPVMHILERGQVYETSVIAGQCFLFLGLLAGLHALHETKTGWLILSGLGWGLAVATRYNLTISVGVFVTCAVFLLWRSGGWSRQTGKRAVALLAPLALCGLALALYNYARFENPFETGLIYQLTLPVYQNQHFSAAYFPANLYVYLFYPLSTSQSFPFFPSIPLQAARLPAWALPPTGQLFDEVFFGVLSSLPILWLLVLLLPFAFFRRAGILPAIFSSRAARPDNSSSGKERSSLLTSHASLLTRMRGPLAGLFAFSGLLQLLFLLVYYYGANRFIADFLLLAMLALIFLAWELDEWLRRLPGLRTLFWLAAALLILATAGIALLAGFDITPQLFRLNNPALYHAIANRANQIYAALVTLPDSPGLLGSALRLLMRLVH